MDFSLSFQGRMARFPYVLSALAAFFSQHLVTVIICRVQGLAFNPDLWFWLVPLRSLAARTYVPPAVLLLAVAYLLIVGWVLAALAFRRAKDAGINEWIAVVAMVPFLQIAAFAFLSVAPTRRANIAVPEASARVDGDDEALPWLAAVHGVVAGVGLTIVAVALGALVFGAYGYGMFVLSPFVIGAMTAYFANRTRDIGFGATASLVAGATALGGVALLLVALEGMVCIVLAAPLGFGMALIGAQLGRAIAGSSRRSRGQALSCLAVLPLVFGLEHVLNGTTQFDTVQSIDIEAPPDVVWNAILHMDLSNEPLTLPYRLGVAYPMRGDVLGEGVGAVRRGEFSTGTAIERVTEWIPERKLAFVVETDVPAMRELSPYEHVHSPHVIGYFRTSFTSFELLPRADGRTTVVEHTSHELKLEPVLYWMPLARWMVGANNARVLTHIAHQSERSRFALAR